MILLSDVPVLPPDHELEQLQDGFFSAFKHHVFMEGVEFPAQNRLMPPYLQLAMASISAVTSPTANGYSLSTGKPAADLSTDLFIAGVNLWAVMLEVDNRESRLVEAVVAVRNWS